MRILVVGGTGTIGTAVATELSQRHEVIVAGNTQGDVQVDIADPSSIEEMYQRVGPIDAVVSTTGKVHFGDFPHMTLEQQYVGINDKLMGQVNLVHIGLRHIKDHGSFTLTSGILNHDPILFGTSAALVNGGLEGFVKAVAIELPPGLRINLVSPTVITEALPAYAPYFRGYKSVSAADAALAYSKSVEGAQTGQIYRVGY